MAATSTNRTRRTRRWNRPPAQDSCERDFESRAAFVAGRCGRGLGRERGGALAPVDGAAARRGAVARRWCWAGRVGRAGRVAPADRAPAGAGRPRIDVVEGLADLPDDDRAAGLAGAVGAPRSVRARARRGSCRVVPLMASKLPSSSKRPTLLRPWTRHRSRIPTWRSWPRQSPSRLSKSKSRSMPEQEPEQE